MERELNILSAIDIPWNSGLAAYAFDQALALRAGGHKVTFACPAGSAAMAFAEREGFPAVAIPGRKEHHKLPLALLRLRAAARDSKIDLVAAHTGRTQTLACLLGLNTLRVKADAKKPSAGTVFTSVPRVITASSYIKGLYLAAGLPAEKITVIPPGIAAPVLLQRAPVPPYRVGLLGRLDLVKGHDCFLKAAAELLASGVSATFHIAGYEANLKYEDLRRAAADLGIEASVFMHGKVDSAMGFISSCDAGVIPSLGSEAVSRAALEWLACGKPLAASAVGSLPEYLPPARLVPPGDPAALAAKLKELLSSPQALAAEGAANRARAEKELGPAAFAAATCAAFLEAAAR
jgi:glycosyltransferase involved in cell wall biosynthesis